jgi:hypothetical protein
VLSISVSTVIRYGQYKCSNRAVHVEIEVKKSVYVMPSRLDGVFLSILLSHISRQIT